MRHNLLLTALAIQRLRLWENEPRNRRSRKARKTAARLVRT